MTIVCFDPGSQVDHEIRPFDVQAQIVDAPHKDLLDQVACPQTAHGFNGDTKMAAEVGVKSVEFNEKLNNVPHRRLGRGRAAV